MSKLKLEDLSNEIILEIFSYLDAKELVHCSHLSRKFRDLSHCHSLWQKMNLHLKIVPSQFVEFLISKGCKYISLSCTKLEGSSKFNIKSHLRYIGSFKLNLA